MASIRKYPTKTGHKWRVQYRSPDGRSRTKQGFKTKLEAQAWADKNAVNIREHRWQNPTRGRATITEIKETWWVGRVDIKPSTLSVEQGTWERNVKPHWGARQVAAITKADIQTWVATSGLGATSIRHAHAMLRQILQHACDEGRITTNPAVGVKLPRKPKPKHIYLTPGQLWQLIDEVTVHKDLVALLGTVGLRWGEAAGLQVRDIDKNARRIHVRRNAVTVAGRIVVGSTKTADTRVVAVSTTVMGMLTPRLVGKRPDAWVFPGSDGGPMRRPTGRHFIKTACERLQQHDPDFPQVTPHGLRHVAAGLMINAGANVLQVSRQLGHAKPSITLDVYSDLWEGGLDELGAMVDTLLDRRGNVVAEEK